MPDLEDRLTRALRQGDALDNVARAASAPPPSIKINDELSLAASAICSIGALHIKHYEAQRARALAGDKGIRVHEVIDLLAIWSNALRCIEESRTLRTRAVQEIEDALESGDYDFALTPAELSVVRRWRGYH